MACSMKLRRGCCKFPAAPLCLVEGDDCTPGWQLPSPLPVPAPCPVGPVPSLRGILHSFPDLIVLVEEVNQFLNPVKLYLPALQG